MTSEEVFPIEFRHQVVTDFARQLVEGSVAANFAKYNNKEVAGKVIEIWFDLTENVSKYFADGNSSDEKKKIEHDMFQRIATLRALGVITEKFSQTQMEQEIERLHSKIDSTNSLLAEILKTMKEL